MAIFDLFCFSEQSFSLGFKVVTKGSEIGRERKHPNFSPAIEAVTVISILKKLELNFLGFQLMAYWEIVKTIVKIVKNYASKHTQNS